VKHCREFLHAVLLLGQNTDHLEPVLISKRFEEL
jgi:hypothetical protein